MTGKGMAASDERKGTKVTVRRLVASIASALYTSPARVGRSG
jgi:hypothetical protein